MKRRVLLALLAALALPGPLCAAEPAAAVPPADPPTQPIEPAAAAPAEPAAAGEPLLDLPVAPLVAQRPHSGRLEDGMALVVVRVPGSDRGSLRFVVKAGSRQDPEGKEGLARLVEHLILRRIPDREPLIDELRAVGGSLDARVSSEATTFLLDAPAEHFPALAERFIGLVSDPSFELSSLDREAGLIAAPEADRTDANAVIRLMEDALFTRDGRPANGTAQSRAAIALKDVVEFFNRHYTPQNMAIVFAGKLEFDEARALVDRAVRVPPTMDEELTRARQRKPLPLLPFAQKLQAPRPLLAHGYLLEEQDTRACEGLADLLGLRLRLALKSERMLADGVEVRCVRMHGHQFIFAFAAPNAIDGKTLPAVVQSVFAKAKKLKRTPREEKLLARREAHRGWRTAGSPAAMAERLVDEAVRGGVEESETEPPTLEEAAARTFLDSRRLLLEFAPSGG